ncbi:hypothetical protein V8F33_004260 [Rhypophila sp. PSN 637]
MQLFAGFFLGGLFFLPRRCAIKILAVSTINPSPHPTFFLPPPLCGRHQPRWLGIITCLGAQCTKRYQCHRWLCVIQSKKVHSRDLDLRSNLMQGMDMLESLFPRCTWEDFDDRLRSEIVENLPK